MLEKVKLALRLRSPAFDVEVEDLIAACKADLELSGIKLKSDDDPLIVRAVVLYCKGNFGYTENGERFIKAYELLKCSLSMAGDYNAVE